MSGAEFELYDLTADPGETQNVFIDYPEVARPLQAALLSWSRGWRNSVRLPTLHSPVLDAETLKQLRSLGYIR
jgi:hypothetical protein